MRHLFVPMLFAAALPCAAFADTGFEIGLRLERLTIDEPIQFSCDQPCEYEDDPNCVNRPDEQLCTAQSLDEPHDGFLFGGLVGVSTGGRAWSLGARLAASIGAFSPVDSPERTTEGAVPDDSDITLGHITFEVPLEFRLGGRGAHGFIQAVPRVGVLNYLEGRDEEADTFTAGILLVAGFRFGVGGGGLGVAGGAVLHPSFNGWLVEGTWRSGGDPPDDDPEPEVRKKPKAKKKPIRKNPKKKKPRR